MWDPSAKPAAERVARILALLTHGGLAVVFFAPFVDVDAFDRFALRTGLFILLWEFVALHAGIMISHVHEKSLTGGRSTILFMAFLYGAFALAIPLAADEPLLLPIFLATLAPKFVAAFTGHWRPSLDEKRDWVLAMAIYAATLVLPILVPLPLPSIPGTTDDPTRSGLWVERPETLAFTGAAYFAFLTLLDLWSFRPRRAAAPTEDTAPESVHGPGAN